MPNSQDKYRQAFFEQIDHCLPKTISFANYPADKKITFYWDDWNKGAGIRLNFYPKIKKCTIESHISFYEWTPEQRSCAEHFAQMCGCNYDNITIDPTDLAEQSDTKIIASKIMPPITKTEQEHYWTSILLTNKDRILRQFAKFQLGGFSSKELEKLEEEAGLPLDSLFK